MSTEYSVTKTANGNWEGSHSHHHLYGAALTSALRDEFRKNGIKGVTASVLTYTGGQRVTIKFTPKETDFIPLADFLEAKKEPINFAQFPWVHHKGNSLTIEECLALPDSERRTLYEQCLTEKYNRYFDVEKDCQEDLSKNPDYYDGIFVPAFIKKMQEVIDIVNAYNYDASDSMSDYFDRGFCEFYKLMPIRRKRN